MRYLPELFDNNRAWADRNRKEDPDYFRRLAAGQQPRVLWIGCADSRVPPDVIVGVPPGEIFVHRNVANVVSSGDVSIHSAVQFAVDGLGVEHVVVCGHYGCGGVNAALAPPVSGPLGMWVDHVRSVSRRHEAELDALDNDARFRRLCELNALAQVDSLAASSIVLDAWEQGKTLYLHSWIYDIETGLLTDLQYDRESG